MNKRVLFSPVGGTDPISENNCHDGSLLHICRAYQPDTVILYMSKEILEKQEQDDRYRFALKRLYEYMGLEQPEIREIRREELNNVHEFDFFYDDFQAILMDLNQSLDGTDELLINVSSGTPAMKSGLLVLETIIKSMGDSSAVNRMIQVATPLRSMSEHTHSGDYDNELMWELNEDNRPDYINRCKEVTAPTLLKLRNEEIIKQQIAAYDYRAALDVAKAMSSYSASHINLLEIANSRMLLDFSSVDKLANREEFDFLPVKGSDYRKIFEYALNMDIKYRRKEYSDFILRITPLIFTLFELVLRKTIKIDIADYTVGGKDNPRWSISKLGSTEVMNALVKHSNGSFTGQGFVYSNDLNSLIQEFSEDDKLKSLANDIRDIERNVRNIAAHQIVSITPDVIEKLTGFTGKQILDKIKALFGYTPIKVKKEDWNSYDRLNEEIVRRMS